MKLKALLPLGIFVILAGFLAVGLQRNPSEVPSPLVGKPAPTFSAQRLGEAPGQLVTPEEFKGKVWVLNVWASWCVPCRVEHPFITALAKRGIAPVVGLSYKDQPSDSLKWLERYGNPYQVSALDLEGRIGIEYGVYGVPETFVIDKQGVIRHKVIGPVSQDILDTKLIPLIQELQR